MELRNKCAFELILASDGKGVGRDPKKLSGWSFGPKRSENLNGNPWRQRADLHGERAFRSSGNPMRVPRTRKEGEGGERGGSDRDEQSPG